MMLQRLTGGMQPVKTVALLLACCALAPARSAAQQADADGDNHFLVGIAADFTGHTTQGPADELVMGPSVTHRWDWFDLGGRIMLGPAAVIDDLQSDDSDLERYRGLLGLHTRAALRVGGIEWTYGIGAHVEARLKDHFWLMYLTPLELGALVWEEGSWRIRALAGLRVVTAGELINVFLLDPNGFDNSVARDELEREKDTPVGAFFGIVFARRID